MDEPQLHPHLQHRNCFNKCVGMVVLYVFPVVALALLGLLVMVVPPNVDLSDDVPSEVTKSMFLIKTLPGFVGVLPIRLETGYIGVGESEDVQLFYYFVESEGNPEKDPLMFMLTGGPGCSGLAKILAETGPFTFNDAKSTSKKLILEMNANSWTKVGNIISLDQPAGAGFSYAKTHEAYITNDTLAAKQAYEFLGKWFVDHPKFLKNPLYVVGDSYGGLLAPMIVQEIYNGNEVKEGPHMNIKGYIIGNGVTDTSDEYNSRIPFAHRMALLSDEIYNSTKANCGGEYLNIDSNNSLCLNDLQVVDKCLERINLKNILEPNCDFSNTLKSAPLRRSLRSLEKASMDFSLLHKVQVEGCPDKKSKYLGEWANRRDAREALHVSEELSDTKWVACNESLKFYYNTEPISYTHDVWSTVAYHGNLSNKTCRALVYSGDHDMLVSYLSTLNWIKSLNLLVVDNWRPWFVDEQVAGYTMKYLNKDYNLTFATIKGGAHIISENKPKECLEMLKGWLVNDAL